MFKAITKFLITKNINLKKYQYNLLNYIRNKDIKKIKRLIDCGLDITFDENQAIYTCGIWNFTEGAELLLKAGADPNRITNFALKHQNLEMVNLLIQYGWDVQKNDNEAIRHASGECKVEIIEALIDAGADVTANDNQAFKNACHYKANDTIKLLIDNGANMYADDHSCIKTSLLINNVEAIKIFVESGYIANDEIISFANLCYTEKEVIDLLKSTIK